jgi:YHS domain-containing protein
MNLRSMRLLAMGIVVAVVTGCGAMNAQNPSGGLRPANAAPDAGGAGLMLKGADVVAYFTMNKFVQGSPQFRSEHQGVAFHFSSAEHKALFDKEPAKYMPQYNGFCANGIAYAIPWGGDADIWRMVGGKLYIFGGQGSMDGWLLDEAKYMKLADGYWKDEVAGSNSFWQRSKRLVFRVPHYLTGEQLAQAVAEAKAKAKAK